MSNVERPTDLAIALERLRAATDEAMGAASLLDDERQRLTDAITEAREQPRSALSEANAMLADMRTERRQIEALLADVKRLREIDVPALISEQVTKALNEGADLVLERMIGVYERTAREAFHEWLREQGPTLLAERFADLKPEDIGVSAAKHAALKLPPPATVNKPERHAVPPITAEPPVVPAQALSIDYRPPYGPCYVVYTDHGKIVSERSARHLTDGRILEERKRGRKPQGNYRTEVRFSDGVTLPVYWCGNDTDRVFRVRDQRTQLVPTDRTARAVGLARDKGISKCMVEYVKDGEVVASYPGVTDGEGQVALMRDNSEPTPEHDTVRARYENGEVHDLTTSTEVSITL